MLANRWFTDTLGFPFAELQNLLNREFYRLLGTTAGSNGMSSMSHFMPTEIVETPDDVRVHIEAPGLRLEDFDVRIENGRLWVSYERQEEANDPDEAETRSRFWIRERPYGRFQRSFALPGTVNPDEVEAVYRNGILSVSLPKVEGAKPRLIPVIGEKKRLFAGKKS